MKNLLLILILAMCSYMMNAQKVDIDNHKFYVEYAGLPNHYVPLESRTFTVDVAGSTDFNHDLINDKITVRGWERNDDAAHMKGVLNIIGFERGASDVSDRTEVKKDKAGKVVSRTTYYKVTSTDIGKATLSIYGPDNKYQEKPKKEKQKKKEKSKKKEKKEKVNPFLQDVNIETTDDSTNTPPDAERTSWKDLSNTYTYTTSESTKKSVVVDEYRINSYNQYIAHREDYNNKLAGYASAALNAEYGYVRKRDYAKFKRLDKDDHPEFEMFENALKATRALLEKKRFNVEYTSIKEALMPVVEYFGTVKEKYKKDEKHQKRLKAAAMYNMAQIYYYLDMPDEVIAIGEEYIRWDHDKGDGEDFVEKGKALKSLLAFHQADGRYVITAEDADAVESEDQAESGN